MQRSGMVCMVDKEYRYYREAFQGCALPFAFVDLDRFDANVAAVQARAGSRTICVATKSIRCLPLIKRILDTSPQFHALMAFTVPEAVYLAEAGLDNILVAYPAWGAANTPGLWDALRSGKRITLMVDSGAHVLHLAALAGQEGVTLPVCMDIDLSSDFGPLHFGVRRSGIQSAAQALSLWTQIQSQPSLRLDGVMGYEAQIAGVGDTVAGNGLKGLVLRYLKRRSLHDVAARREAIVTALRGAGAPLRFVNGGGTGSMETTCAEAVVTEVTVGSGFFSPVLFDHYHAFKHEPAAGFAVEITRQPKATIFTTLGGGYVASGAPGRDRLPQPYLPAGATLLPLEGAGEVQTPVHYAGPAPLLLGDPIFFRHSKAGELCERFNALYLVKDGAVVDEVPTYRGDGRCFL